VLAAAEAPVNAHWSGPLDRVQADLAQLNLCYLQLAREFARSAREVALTRLGLDAEACAALEGLSLADVQTLAQSRALIFGLRLAPSELAAQAALARTHPVVSEARLLLAARRP
jgi:hypothetical protein